jgi:hypothetical protein
MELSRKLYAALFPFGRHKQFKEQISNSLLLKLPSEVILDIADCLPAHSQLVLGQTCRAMHHILQSRNQRNMRQISQWDYVDYLLSLTRNDPDTWVCDNCLQCHRVHEWDTPSQPNWSRCPKPWEKVAITGHRQKEFRLAHRHVQLSLKYSRLGDGVLGRKHKRHLARLMRRHEQYGFLTFSPQSNTLSTVHAAFPKIVNGRYLVLHAWLYEKWITDVSQNSMGYLRPCRHQSFQPPAWWVLNISDFSRAIMYARDNPKTVYGTHCTSCGIDFEIVFSPESAIVKAFFDFGVEGSIDDVNWRASVFDFRRDPLLVKGPAAPQAPGSVRELYYSDCSKSPTKS